MGSLLMTIASFLILGFLGAPLILWSLAFLIVLIGLGAPPPVLLTFIPLALIFNIRPLRRILLSSWLMGVMKPLMPKISETERVALEAGVVWIEKDLFSGRPDFRKMLKEPYPELNPEEKAFLEGPVERLCKVVDDWKVWIDRDLPPEAWALLKKEKFFGMIIPKGHGGLGFSALANSAVVQKLASRSIPLAVTAMVPNSLGPAELLVHYGTEVQKKRYLPRLATGEEIPAFALTEPLAGSDAGSIRANGLLFKGPDGKLYLKLNWNKRWITLASIATLLGLAFKLRDPENLLGKGEDVGITCALIPTNLKGVDVKRRHDPLAVPFYNCPTEGHDVVVPAEEAIIGGLAMAGKGWKMLMESLGAGRGISLPAQASGGAKLVTRVISAHATVRKQFGVSIGQFEGIEEPLARIASYNYLLEAVRRFTCGAIDKGIKPPVITAMVKYNATEIGRKVINDGMDIQGGQAISRGPRNLLAHVYFGTPITLTVEGANIMTRTLIVFGQGALRAHPYAFREVDAIGKRDLAGFDSAFWGHLGHVVQNLCRAVLLSATRGYLAPSPVSGPVRRYYQKLSWISATFATMADVAMAGLGGMLKVREKITGRFADILSWMYLGFSVLRRFEAEGRRGEDLPFVHFCLQFALVQVQRAFDGIFENIGIKGFGWFFRGPVRLWSHFNSLGDEPSDHLTHQIARLIQENDAVRERMTEGIFVPTREGEALHRLEQAFKVIKAAERIQKKMREAVKKGVLARAKGAALVEAAMKAGVITREEAEDLKRSEQMGFDAITVDDFSQEEFLSGYKEREFPGPRSAAAR